MTVGEVLSLARKIALDTNPTRQEYGDGELIGYLNTAITALWTQLQATGNTTETIGDVTMIAQTEAAPADFSDFAGRYPVIKKGTNLVAYDTAPIEIRYVKKPPLFTIATKSALLPFDNEALNHLLGHIIATLALNRNEYDISQDKALLDEIRKLIR